MPAKRKKILSHNQGGTTPSIHFCPQCRQGFLWWVSPFRDAAEAKKDLDVGCTFHLANLTKARPESKMKDPLHGMAENSPTPQPTHNAVPFIAAEVAI